MRGNKTSVIDRMTGYRFGREVMPKHLLTKELLEMHGVPEPVWSKTITFRESWREARVPSWVNRLDPDVQSYLRSMPDWWWADYKDYGPYKTRSSADWRKDMEFVHGDPKKNRVRDLQDEILKLAGRQGISPYIRVSKDMPANITLSNLRTMIYPEYEPELRGVLAALQGN